MIFVGNCEKYDLVVLVASLIKAITKGEVAIVTDSDHSYKYFDGEVCGVPILKSTPDEFMGVLIYDCYQVILPDITKDSTTVLFTTLDRPTYESSVELSYKMSFNTLVYLYEDCVVDEKVLDLNFGAIVSRHAIENTPGRRIDMLHEERINFKKLDKQFKEVVSELVSGYLNQDIKEVRKYWDYLEKQGYGTRSKKWGLF